MAAVYENLRAFVCTVERGSLSQAASELYLSPVAVMKRINRLESWVGLPLLTRTNKGVVPTEAGKSVYGDARRLLAETREMVDRAWKAAGAKASTVRVSAPYAGSIKVLTDLWNHAGCFSAQFIIQVVPIGIKYDSVEKVYDLLDNVTDFVIGPFDRERHPKLEGLEIGRLALCIAVQRDHPLAKKTHATVGDLSGMTVGMVKRGHVPPIDAVRSYLETHGARDIAIVDNENDYNMDAYDRYWQEGNTMIAPEGYSELQPSIATVPLEPPMYLPIFLVGTRETWDARARFVEALQGAIAERDGRGTVDVMA